MCKLQMRGGPAIFEESRSDSGSQCDYQFDAMTTDAASPCISASLIRDRFAQRL
jgi:hypothetical protein